eukprot:8261998-Karenia_brevis.AAC.1
MGLPGLSPNDQVKVKEGNKMMYLAVRIFRLCVSLKVPSSIENPERSRLWIAPAMKVLAKMR